MIQIIVVNVTFERENMIAIIYLVSAVSSGINLSSVNSNISFSRSELVGFEVNIDC
jgi:hypothetical protein